MHDVAAARQAGEQGQFVHPDALPFGGHEQPERERLLDG
jgi:hypothetical protein